MIKVNEDVITFSGDSETILSEFTSLITVLRDALTEKYGEKTADMLIARAGQIAYMTEAELDKELEDEYDI